MSDPSAPAEPFDGASETKSPTSSGADPAPGGEAAERESTPWWAHDGLSGLVGPLGLLIAAGLAAPVHFGLVLPLVVLGGLALVGERRLRIIASGAGSEHATPAARGSVVALTAVTAGLLLTVLARAVGALLVEFPGALWGLAAAVAIGLCWALVGPRVPARARPVILLVLAGLVPLAGLHGTRYEAEGADARGWAHSGPVLGIHPFQITSVIIDGYGPHDLPINDYVEPDGSRGYGPQALGEFLDRSLQSIADRAYADGPAQAYRAFADAKVEVVQTDAVWERLDREPYEPTQSRFIVHSGSFGARSRVEFVCPGRRIDPRGPRGETVMNRMCPDKYAAEASAGLGVTGRWSGYSEGRGTPRTGLSAWFGWTRTHEQGATVIEREIRGWAIVVLLIAFAVAVGPAAGVGAGLRGAAGGLVAAGILAVLVLVFGASRFPAVSAFESGPPWSSLLDPLPWMPALVLAGAGMFALAEPPAAGAASGAARGRGLGTLAVAMLAIVTVVGVASSLPALDWIAVVGPDGARLPRFVRGAADAYGEGTLTVFEVEGVIAASLAAVLLGAAVALVRVTGGAAQRLSPGPAWVTPAAIATGLAIAAAFVVSRKTSGAAALMPTVVGMTLVLGSSLVRISRPGKSTPLSLVIHLTWSALGVALAWLAVAPHRSEPLVMVYAGVGVAVMLTAAVLCARPGRLERDAN